MRTHQSLLLKPAPGWLAACVLVSLFVLTGASADDVFARHVGMSVSSAATPKVAADVEGPVEVSDTGAAAEGVRSVLPAHESGGGDDAAHMLHLLGACLAILYAGALLVRRRGWWARSARATAVLPPTLVLAAPWLAGVRRGPPRLSPPRFSPVIRT